MDPYSILAAILVLAVVIFVHELGHFSVAKWCDVEVRTFSMGFGPTVWSRTVGETEYRVAAIPLGGYVSMAGQDDDDDSEAPSDPSRGFTAKSVAQRTAIVAAGPAVNFVFAAVVFASITWIYGTQVPSDSPVVGDVFAGSAAEAAGLEPGDRVIAVDGRPMATWDDLVSVLRGSEGATMALELENPAGERRSVSAAAKLQEQRDVYGEVVGQTFLIGIGRAFESQPATLPQALSAGVSATWGYSKMILGTVSRLLMGRLEARNVGGPIMIVQEASRQAKQGMEPLLAFLALISVNLGVINILPIPVLDGGHLAFLGVEALRGKPLSVRVREGALQLGMVLLGALMIFVVFNDIVRIAGG